MFSDIELKSFDIIDNFLQHLVNKGHGSVYDLSKDFYSTESQMAYKIMCDNELISFRKGYPDKNSIIDIAQNGLTILKYGGYKTYITKSQESSAEKERLEFEKLNSEIIDIRNRIFDYDSTKRRTVRSEWIAIVSVAIALITLMSQLLCNKPL